MHRRALMHLFAALVLLLCCITARAQTSVSIHDIMTNLPNTPLLGQNVITDQGVPIVVGVIPGVAAGSNGGFYITLQTWDNLVSTSEGIFVAGSSIAGCQVSVGDVVKVTGVVTNTTAPNLTAADTPGTYLTPSACTVTGTAAMSQSISLSGSLASFGDALKYTGMAVSNPSFYAVEPTTGTLASGAGAVTSTGQFWATLGSNASTNNHIFRSAGIAGDEYKPASAPAGVPTWSGNPQRVLIDTTTFGGSPVDITVGRTVTCTNSGATVGATRGIGVVDYTLGYARILIYKNVSCTVSGSVTPSTSAVADAQHFKVGTLDVNTFLGQGGSSVQTLALAKAVSAVTGVFGSPDIFALQQVGQQDTLAILATAANAANSGSTAYSASVVGSDTVNSGFLINTNTVKNLAFVESGRGATYTTAAGGSATLWDHPPLVMSGEFVRTGKNYPVTVVNVDFVPRDNIDDATLGPDIRTRRAAQAAAVSALVQQYQSAGANVIVAGNFNAYEFDDGYVDVVGIVKGAPAAATAVTLYQASSTTAALTDFTTSVAATSRYNVIERGNAASLEHILASSTVTDSTTAAASLASYINVVTQPHWTTDFAAVSANDSSTPAGLTPHDGFLVNFAIPPVPTTATLSPTALNFGDVSIDGGSATLPLTFTNTTSFTATVNVSKIAITGTNATEFTETDNCTAVAENASCTINVTFAPLAVGTRSATLTVTSDSTSDPTLTASLTGNGIPTTATLSPASATFASTYAGGGVSAAQTFTFTNTSAIAIAFKAAAVTANFNLQTNNCPASVAAGASCTLLVTFVPTTSGALSGTLLVTDGSSANPTLTATLNGTGLPTTATLSPTTQAFGNVVLGSTSATFPFIYTNTSAIALTVTAASATGDFHVVTNGCGTVAAGASCTVGVAFTPTLLGARTGTLTVTNTASANPTLTAALSGRGVADVEASVSALDFGAVDVGSHSAAQTLTITNYTSAAIALTGLAVTGDFASSTSCGAVLPGLSTCTVALVFTPTAVGPRTGTLTVTTNDTKYPVITVALTGSGADFSVAVLPTSGSMIAGNGTVAATVTATALGGFSAPVTMTCTFQAVASTCTLANPSFTLSGTTVQQMSMTTTGQYTLVGYGFGGGGWRGWPLAALAAGAALLLAIARRRTPAMGRLLAGVLLLLALGGGLAGCSSKYPSLNSPYTEPGSYVYTVTATDGTLTRTATYTLAVRQRN